MAASLCSPALYQDVDGSEFVHHFAEHRLHLVFLGYIGFDRNRAASVRGGCLSNLMCRVVSCYVVHYYVRAGLAEGNRHGLSDAGVS